MARSGSGTMMVRNAGRMGGRRLFRKKRRKWMAHIGRLGGVRRAS